MKLWSPKGGVNKQIEEFTVGNDYLIDRALVKYDAIASKAHARMLGKIGILSDNEVTKLTEELDTIIQLAEDDAFDIQPEQEDCHTAIEGHLTAKLGELGKKIHTARSRNDQVLAALRLYYKDQLDALASLAQDFIRSVSEFTVEHGEVEFPGYTHTRKAMPATVNMWGSAFVQSMQDNFTLIRSAKQLIDQSPLGTGAGYGVPLDVDREFTAEELGFGGVQQSPVYVQNSRGKFEAHILHVCSQVMLDLNRLATDLIFFSMPGIGYFDLPDEFCTGSSIMPQKKNPDVFELVRAKYHTVLGYQQQIQSMVANLISGYHRDYQLTKEPEMQGLNTTLQSLSIMTFVFSGLGVNRENCEAGLTDEVYATQRAYELVKQGVPFREAYKQISEKYR